MTERLLQYIWQFQHFNSGLLQTTAEQSLQVIQPGNYNTNQGPDFLNAKIKIADTIWAGSIELHINTSDWQLHNHSNDKNYSNVILHVVWNDDQDLQLSFPTLELQNRVSKLLLKKYDELMQGTKFIPCEDQVRLVNEITLISWKERLLVERLQQKAQYIETLLQLNNGHWEETFWWILARNFGAKINCDAFEKIAQSIPMNVLAKHKQQLQQLEALLMGQAGLLEKDFEEDYPIMLQKEYRFLQKKYRLNKVHVPVYFLRMRPANFPSIRLAQLAALIQQSQHLFSSIKGSGNSKEVVQLFSITANDYWHYHYVFDEAGSFKKKALGSQMVQNIMINTVIPVLYAYGYFNNSELYKNKALKWMEEVAAESNSITRGFELLGIENRTAFDSQALIQLKNEYCDLKRCLQCAIGNKILKEI
ncbi:MAG: DUF2851 family protein [Ferruginibacter sp.]